MTENRDDGTITIIGNDGNVVFDGDRVNSGGTINLIGSALGTAANPVTVSGGTVNLQEGSTFYTSGGLAATVNIDPSTVNTLYLSDPSGASVTSDTAINGVSADTRFGVEGDSAPVSAAYTPNADGSYTLTITLADGNTIRYGAVHFAEGYAPSGNVTIAQDGADRWLIEETAAAACFLAGTLIRTPEGDVAVEDIRIGDRVTAFTGGRQEARTVVWVGRARMVVRQGVPDDEAGYPVRVLADAVADGVPARDLLVTPEHCFFIDGVFIPARMLVNGRSIAYDHGFSFYDYFHIETENHAVIMAEGMLTESYLDTGDRARFRQQGKVARLAPQGGRSWTSDAAAPLAVARETVEPLHRRIEARALARGLVRAAPPSNVTDDPDLRLATESGAVIRPAREAGGRVVFMLPPGVRAVRVLSRASRPSDAVGPFVDDRRSLGVLVGEVQLLDGGEVRAVEAHLREPGLAGWDAIAGGPCRWTRGDALLPLGPREADRIALLVMQIVEAGPYVLENDAAPEMEVTFARTA